MRDMRLGRFKVSRQLLEDMNREVLKIVFKDIVVLKAYHDIINGVYEYIANHPTFEVVEEGTTIPEYRAILNLGVDAIRWEKL